MRPIGHGGMGVVYEAEAVAGGGRFAVKILDREHARDNKVVARFAPDVTPDDPRLTAAIEAELAKSA